MKKEQRYRTRLPIEYNFIFQTNGKEYGIKNLSEGGITFENKGETFQKSQRINGKLINKENNRILGNIEGTIVWSDGGHSGAKLYVSPESDNLIKLYRSLIKKRIDD